MHGPRSPAPLPLARPVRGSPARRARPFAYVTGGHAGAPAPGKQGGGGGRGGRGARVGAARWGTEVSDCLRVRRAGGGGRGTRRKLQQLLVHPSVEGTGRGQTRFATHCQGALFGCTPPPKPAPRDRLGGMGDPGGGGVVRVRNHAPPPPTKANTPNKTMSSPTSPPALTLQAKAYCPPPDTRNNRKLIRLQPPAMRLSRNPGTPRKQGQKKRKERTTNLPTQILVFALSYCTISLPSRGYFNPEGLGCRSSRVFLCLRVVVVFGGVRLQDLTRCNRTIFLPFFLSPPPLFLSSH